MRDLENPDTLSVRLNYGTDEDCVGTVEGDAQGKSGYPCAAKVHTTYEFVGKSPTPFICYTMPWSRDPKEDSLLRRYNILGESYRLFAYTLNIRERNHFVAIIMDKGMRFRYDDLRTEDLTPYTAENRHTVSSVFLIRED
jgi:hypothetical protein